ncbi:hypothetical protein PMAYCL1PPCAC_16812, partial [Pristionchus mayeri]
IHSFLTHHQLIITQTELPCNMLSIIGMVRYCPYTVGNEKQTAEGNVGLNSTHKASSQKRNSTDSGILSIQISESGCKLQMP